MSQYVPLISLSVVVHTVLALAVVHTVLTLVVVHTVPALVVVHTVVHTIPAWYTVPTLIVVHTAPSYTSILLSHYWELLQFPWSCYTIRSKSWVASFYWELLLNWGLLHLTGSCYT